MGNIKEEDLDAFKITCKDRFSPDVIKIFFWGVFIYTSIPMGIMFVGALLNGDKISLGPFEKIVVQAEIKLYILEFIFLMLFTSSKIAFKLQKIQSIVMLFYSFQIATLPYMFVLIKGVFGFSYENKTLVYFALLLLGAIATHIVVTINTFKKAKYGGYRLEGGVVSLFTARKLQLSIGMFIYVIVLLVLIFVSIPFQIEPIMFYIVQTVILYIFAIASAEFILLVYCRFKFPSFNITWEQHEKERQEFIANRRREEQKQSKN
ncbi:hypothetical protein [Bacillus sp. BP-3]|uniref:hypothetical protein n=1 Tax=Bacillus sp. BP-3 TaxID=3022773 RepID=UPI00232B4E79|nr:hypothetical protein [Bacillus sp. BP-3]MDC2865199.1 hypothetical protein [Bacillus sp. BP-3]